MFKPAGVAVQGLWGIVVDSPPGVRALVCVLAEGFWKVPPEWVRAPYVKTRALVLDGVPE